MLLDDGHANVNAKTVTGSNALFESIKVFDAEHCGALQVLVMPMSFRFLARCFLP